MRGRRNTWICSCSKGLTAGEERVPQHRANVTLGSLNSSP